MKYLILTLLMLPAVTHANLCADTEEFGYVTTVARDAHAPKAKVEEAMRLNIDRAYWRGLQAIIDVVYSDQFKDKSPLFVSTVAREWCMAGGFER